MTTQQIHPLGWDDAQKAIEANTSLRWKRLENLERWAAGTQYQGRPNWFNEEDVPLWEREPCIVYPIVQIAIQSNVDLVLGEGRFPTFSSKPSEDEAEDENGLGEEDSATLDRFIAEHHKICSFHAHAREAFEASQKCGTTITIHGVRNGLPFGDVIPAKWGTAKLDADGAVTELEIRYPYLEEYRRPDGKWATRAKIYRRVVDAVFDTTFLPAEASARFTDDPNWTVDKNLSVKHELGFCPAIWYAHMKGCAPVNQVDGHAIHELVLDEIQAHDIARSQWHRCALLSEPQICETGVEPGHNPTASGRTVVVPTTAKGGAITDENPVNGAFSATGPTKGARKKGPGHVWQYPNSETKISTLTFPADALKAQQENCTDLRIKLQESMCVVLLEPENLKSLARMSGRALEALRQRQLDRCSQYRDDFAERFLRPTIDMQLRIAQRVGRGLRVPGIKKVLPILNRFQNDGVAIA